MSTTTHPRLVSARRTTATLDPVTVSGHPTAGGGASAAAAAMSMSAHDPDRPMEWAREDTLFVVLLVAAIMFCGGIGLFAL